MKANIALVHDFPKVSVFVLSYRHALYVRECLDSIRAQNWPNLEVIVIDDASPENDSTIIADYQRSYPGFITHFIRHDKNMGIAFSANEALTLATGVYVVPFAGDDIMLPEKLMRQVTALQAAPDKVLCFSNMEWFLSGSGKTICRHFGILQRPSTDLRRVVMDFSVPTPAIMLRIDERTRHIRYRDDLKFTNDFMFVVEFMCAGDMLYIPLVLVRYRKHRKSVTAQNFFYDDRVRLLAHLRRLLPSEYKNALHGYSHTLRYAQTMELIQDGRKIEALRQFPALVLLAFRSPKWMARFGTAVLSLIRPVKKVVP